MKVRACPAGPGRQGDIELARGWCADEEEYNAHIYGCRTLAAGVMPWRSMVDDEDRQTKRKGIKDAK
jgi:hypothetical protein